METERKRLDVLAGQRRGLGALADEAGDARGVADHVPAVVVELAAHEEVAGEHLLLDDDLLAALELDDVLHRDDDLVDALLHVHGRGAGLEVLLDLLLVARLRVDDVPAARAGRTGDSTGGAAASSRRSSASTTSGSSATASASGASISAAGASTSGAASTAPESSGLPGGSRSDFHPQTFWKLGVGLCWELLSSQLPRYVARTFRVEAAAIFTPRHFGSWELVFVGSCQLPTPKVRGSYLLGGSRSDFHPQTFWKLGVGLCWELSAPNSQGTWLLPSGWKPQRFSPPDILEVGSWSLLGVV